MRLVRWPGALVATAALAVSVGSSAPAAVAAGSGDTCTAVGHGTEYSLAVNVASAAAPQYGFAVGAASGVSIESIAIPGIEGSFLTSGLPQGTSGTWINSTQIPTGSMTVNVTTTGPVKSFSVVPASAPSPATYLDPIVCTVTAAGPATPSASFTIDRPVSYDSSTKAWRLSVTIASAGRVSAAQPEATVGTAAPRSVTKKPLVQARRMSLRSPGKVTLMLRPTSRGQSMLATTGSIKLKLLITFIPNGGKAATKSISLVLKK